MWFIQFITSSIGKKLVMSLTGLFLISFLVVHLIGNLQLLYSDGGEAFNIYAQFMTTFLPIKVISYGLYAGIILHAIQGILIAWQNKKAKGVKYEVSTYENGSWASKNMALLGILIFAFLCIHMGDFWYSMHWGDLPMVTYEGHDTPVKDLYAKVSMSFSQWWIVVIYLVGLLALALHLLHGFQSAFTTLGLVHKKYTPIIRALGIGYSILIPLAYAAIPLTFVVKNLWNY